MVNIDDVHLEDDSGRRQDSLLRFEAVRHLAQLLQDHTIESVTADRTLLELEGALQAKLLKHVRESYATRKGGAPDGQDYWTYQGTSCTVSLEVLWDRDRFGVNSDMLVEHVLTESRSARVELKTAALGTHKKVIDPEFFDKDVKLVQGDAGAWEHELGAGEGMSRQNCGAELALLACDLKIAMSCRSLQEWLPGSEFKADGTASIGRTTVSWRVASYKNPAFIAGESIDKLFVLIVIPGPPEEY